jgi:hypothetical protein
VTQPSRDEVLSLIRNGLADAENAIRSHPETTAGVYTGHVETFARRDYTWARHPEGGVPELSDDEVRLIDRYMLVMSFMSAWYHLHGDKVRRDKAAQSAATLVSGTGLDPIFVFKAMLHYERLWRKALVAAGVAARPRAGWAAVLALLVFGACLLALLTRTA